jgi:thiol-disulfide isomerase/thioredoxin
MKTIVSLSLLTTFLAFVGCGKSEPLAEASEARPDRTTSTSVASASVEDTSSLPQLGAAPAWTLSRVDGSTLTSAELAGKVVVIDFWATWCPPCREEIPGYIAMQRELESAGLVIVGVSLDQGGPGVVNKFNETFKMNYPLVMGDEKMVDAFGGIEAIPTTFLIDRNGQIRHRKVGMMDRSEYEPLVKSLL